jgi:branched-chain amino acid transport system substrate-binding protein
MKKWTLLIACLAIVVALSFGPLSNHAGAADVVKWGVLIDLSGPTSDWGKNQVKGQLDAMRWINEHGGILATTGWLIRKKSQGFIFNLRAPP